MLWLLKMSYIFNHRHQLSIKRIDWPKVWEIFKSHYNDVIMSVMASLITSLTIVCLTIYLSGDQRKHQSSASPAFVRGIHRWLMNSPHKGPVTQKMSPLYDVIMLDVIIRWRSYCRRFYFFSINNYVGLKQTRASCRCTISFLCQWTRPGACVFFPVPLQRIKSTWPSLSPCTVINPVLT